MPHGMAAAQQARRRGMAMPGGPDAARSGASRPAFFAGGGEMAALMRAHDWSASPLGHPETWPRPLRTVVDLMLGSAFPMFVAWGPELAFLYNDGYRPIFGAKHPHALGRPFREVWSEIWDDVSPLVDRAMAGEATWSENLHLVMERSGYPEDTWYTFSYSPVRDESGAVAGMFCACTETTGKVLAEAALRESEDHYRHAVELNPQVVWTAAPDGQADHVAQRWFEWTGNSGLGETWSEVIHPDDLVPSVEGWTQSLASGEPYDVEHRVRLRSGAYRWMRSRAYARRDAGGRIVKWYGATESIHGHRLAEEKLRESERRFRNVADHAPVMIWVTDATGACIYLNRRWHEFTGQSEAEGLGFGWLDMTHPDDKAAATDAFVTANVGHAPFRVEYRLRRADGSYAYAIDAAAPRFGPDGAFLGYIGSVIDITERRQAEEIIRGREESLRHLANTVPAFVWFADPSGSVHFLNDRWYEYTGQTPEDALPDGWVDALHPDDRARTAETWADARARGVLYEVEVRYRRHDGSYRWYLARAEPLRDEAGWILRWFGTSIDIDDRKRAEAHQRLLINELNHRVKNTLATVQAIAAQSFRPGDDLAQGREAFTARIVALAAAHDVLTRESWEGADLTDIVAGAVQPFQRGERDRFRIHGSPVRLAPKTALAFALALHELATNAAKYGALSDEAGCVEIGWTVASETGVGPEDRPSEDESEDNLQEDGLRLLMRWEESGGPPVTAPTRRGFGSRLIERGLAAELRGEVRILYEPSGVVCTIDAHLAGWPDEERSG